MTLKHLFTIIFLSNAITSYCQLIEIRGKIVDISTGRPLSFASVFCKVNYYLGTTANERGEFILAINNGCDSIVVSHLGYSPTVLASVKLAGPSSAVPLTPSVSTLREVVISSMDSSEIILERAFNNIEKNYPKNGMLVKGHYRETNFLQRTRQFLYFSEALVRFFNPGYADKLFGPVELIQGGKFEEKNRNSFSNTYFFGGPYVAQRIDVAKQRFDFIRPNHFNKYFYTLLGEVKYNGLPTYKIKFTPKYNGEYEGILYVEKTSFAYVGCDFKLSESGLKSRNSFPKSALKHIGRTYSVRYNKVKNLWIVNSAAISGKLFSKKTDTLIYEAEFVAREIKEQLSNPISRNVALPYTSIYTLQRNKFSNDYWQSDQHIKRASRLDSAIANNLVPRSGKDSKQYSNLKAIEIASKITNTLLIGYVPLKISAGSYQLHFRELFSANNSIEVTNAANYIDYGLAFHASQRLRFGYSAKLGITKHPRFTFQRVDIGARQAIAGWRRPLVLEAGIGFFSSKVFERFKTPDTTATFTIQQTDFATNNIKLAIVHQQFGLSPFFGLSYKIATRISVITALESLIRLRGYDLIHIQRTNGLFPKKAKVRLNEGSFFLERDSEILSSSPVKLPSLTYSLSIGLRIGLY
ncbi:MAG TPA: carboxypeptidase-like regulatory domain-containing protein [Chryseosolibacter sp.]